MADQHDSPTRAAESPSADHKAHGPSSVACRIITCSDTRTPETDTSGQLIRALLEEAGHRIHAYHVVKDEPTHVRSLIRQSGVDDTLDALIINGGTGMSQRDSTFEAVNALLEKHIPGFGELFRSLSYKDIGSSAHAKQSTSRPLSRESDFFDSRIKRRGSIGHGSPDSSRTFPSCRGNTEITSR